jgi:hypothetical protein
MRRHVALDRNRQPFTIPDDEPVAATGEIEIDCIHCRALRARAQSLSAETFRAKENRD